MVVDSAPAGSPAPAPASTRTVHLSAYVALPLPEVQDRFAGPDIDDLLAACMRAALGAEASVNAHAATPVWESATNARVPVTWTALGSQQTHEGTATLSLLMVQSGRDAITELHLALPFPEEVAAEATTLTHRFLDALTARLERPTG